MPRKKATSTTPTPTRQSRRRAASTTEEADSSNIEHDQSKKGVAAMNAMEQQSLKNTKTSQPSSLSTTLQQTLVGGPLLGKRPESISGGNTLVGWDTFEPIITPEIVSTTTAETSDNQQRFILLPHTRYITVLAYQTGIKVATLVPLVDEDNDDTNNNNTTVLIASVALAKYRRRLSESSVQDVLQRMHVDDDEDNENAEDGGPIAMVSHNPVFVDELVLMVGCVDGSIREFSLKDLVSEDGPDTSNATNCGPFQIQGPTIRPRRIVRISGRTCPILHVTVPHLRGQVREEGILTYVAREMEREKGVISMEVTRIMIPHYDGTNLVEVSATTEGTHDQLRTVDQFKCCVHKSVAGKIESTLPFKMISAGRLSAFDMNTSQGRDYFAVFVVLARMDSVSVYFEILDSAETFTPILFKMPPNNPLTAIDIGLNKSDITCGHYKGNIRVLNNALDNVEKYHVALSTGKRLVEEGKSFYTPKHPERETISSRVHWHALPVSSLVYDTMSYPMDPLLYSGGDECVLVTWQIAQGRDRPVDVQPRLALGGIVHVASSDRCDDNAANGILVYCDDNTLQLVMSHNKGQVWKVQGLAGFQDENDVAITFAVASLEVDPRSSADKNASLVITGLSQAPGYIHWFNPSNERLDASLEVAPFNRISRNEPDELPLPTPSVACHSFSESGSDLITVDEYPTENVFVGSYEDGGKDQNYGVVSTIRFWTWIDAMTTRHAGVPYDQVASMTFPHGPKNRISAAGISGDGKVACTVSFHEKAFRVWQKIPPASTAVERVGEQPAHTWTCRYKVTIPSGFSNHTTRNGGVAFSKDASILAISFGQFVTLWDVDEARMLTSFSHILGNAAIDSVQFVDPGLHRDLLLVQSKNGIALRSPYGVDGSTANFKAWLRDCTKERRDWVVASVHLVEISASIAVALYSQSQNRSRIVLLDSSSGSELSRGDFGSAAQAIDGRIMSLCAVGKRPRVSNWEQSETSTQKNATCLYGLSSTGHLYMFSDSLTDKPSVAAIKSYSAVKGSSSDGPRLEMLSVSTASKRQRVEFETDATNTMATHKKTALEVLGFGSSEGGAAQPSTSNLPSLGTGNFVRSFVGRLLSRNVSQPQ